MDKKRYKEEERKTIYLQLTASSLGIELVIATLLGALLGNWLDNRWGTRPWLLLTGVVLGAAIGIIDAWRQYQKLVEDEVREKEERDRDEKQ